MLIKCGEYIGSGAQHNVYERGADQVVKVSNLMGNCWDKLTFKTMKQSLDVISECPIPLVATELVDSPEVLINGVRTQVPYAVIQEKINCRVMNELDLQTPELAALVSDAVAFSVDLYNNCNQAVDFLGFEALKQCIKSFFTKSPLGVYNVFMTDDGLRLLDTRLFNLNEIRTPFKPIVRSLANFQHDALAYVTSRYQPVHSYEVQSNWFYSEVAKRVYNLLVNRRG